MSSIPQVDLIPRETLFGNPEKAQVRLSPDGRRIAYLGPSEYGVLNVWIRSVDEKDDEMVTSDTERGIRSYAWAYDDRHILYIQDTKGDENWHLYATDVATKETRNLTPFEGVRAQNIVTDREVPGAVYVGLNKRDPRVFDMFRLDLDSGRLESATENPGDVQAWMTDHEFRIRAAYAVDPDSGDSVVRIRDGEDQWRELIRAPFTENLGPVGFTEDGVNLYIKTSLGSDTTKLAEIDVASGEETRVIAHRETVDAGGVMQNPIDHRLEAVSFTYHRRDWQILDDRITQDFDVLAREREGDFAVGSRNRADDAWIVAYQSDIEPTAYYIYDRASKALTFLWYDNPTLGDYVLASMEPLEITARDGRSLVSYLTTPPNVTADNLPLVLYVHGGPWGRDTWGFDATAQWPANRGYAVLQVSFRASVGFGKEFLNAGNGQWGRAMQDDLTDAARWAVEAGIADPDRVAIFGGSYGGYAVLAGLTFTPELYRCGVDIVGPSNPRTLLATIPPYWAPMKRRLLLRIGDVEDDEEFNRSVSPLFHVEKIRAPLIIAQGANDPRVKISESDQVVSAMREKDLPVTYVVYSDEGHGFARPQNRLDFFARSEQFLATHLGGRSEPIGTTTSETAELR